MDAPPTYWLIPAGRRGDIPAETTLRRWLDQGRWGLPNGWTVVEGDRLAFYASKRGIVAHARVAADVTRIVTRDDVPDGIAFERRLWFVELEHVHWLREPIPITADVLNQLDIIRGKRAVTNWGWLVHTKRRLSQSDFQRLTATLPGPSDLRPSDAPTD